MADLVFQQVLAVIDKRTTAVCLHAAGQIRPIGTLFTTLLGEQEGTPFHVHCRSQVIPWMPGFVSDIRDAANTELLTRPLKERRIGPNGETGWLPPLAQRPPTGPGTGGLRSVQQGSPTGIPRGQTSPATAAEAVLEVATEIEPEVTARMIQLANEVGGEMTGLEFRLKELESLVRKVDKEMREAVLTAVEAAESMSDVLRYTMQAPLGDYAAAAQGSIDSLRAAGFRCRVKNSWGSEKNPYRGVNVAVTDPSGHKFELQFHTQQSFDVKNGEMHRLYEEARKSTDPALSKRLNEQMFALSDTVDEPPGARGIK